MILVTGATGLVGSHLVLHLLEQNHEVKALFRNENGKQKVKTVFAHSNKEYLFEQIIWCQADILDVTTLEIAFQEVTKVYHCAALISFDPNNEEKLRKINIEGTANVVNLCLDFDIKKLCYVSSTSALGDLLPHEKIVTEETEWNPEISHSDYAISKYGAEMEVWRGQQEGLNVVVVNPGVILGPLFWEEGSGEIYQKVKNGLKFYTKGITAFVTVTDVIKAMFLLMESQITNQKFILVSENKSYQEVLFAIADVLHVKKPAFYANAISTSSVWKIDWFLNVFFGKKRSLSKNLANALHSEDFYLNDKICKTLDFKFQNISNYLKTINP
jgi:dihydroflavonol-4-reductase